MGDQMDLLTLFATVAASVAAAAACIAVWQGRGAGKDLRAASLTLRGVLDQGQRLAELQYQAVEEQRGGTRQLEASVGTLGEVLLQATQLVELQRQALAELQAVVKEQHLAAREARLHRQVDRLTVVGERVEDLRLAVETTRFERLYGRDTTHVVAAAVARLTQAVASTGGDVPLPHSAMLARPRPRVRAQRRRHSGGAKRSRSIHRGHPSRTRALCARALTRAGLHGVTTGGSGCEAAECSRRCRGENDTATILVRISRSIIRRWRRGR
jgi:hypothetical protein